MLMNLSEATDIVKGMLHTYCLPTNVYHWSVCAQGVHLLMPCVKVLISSFINNYIMVRNLSFLFLWVRFYSNHHRDKNKH